MALLSLVYAASPFADEALRKQEDVPVLPMAPEDDYVPGDGMPYAMDWNRWVWHR